MLSGGYNKKVLSPTHTPLPCRTPMQGLVTCRNQTMGEFHLLHAGAVGRCVVTCHTWQLLSKEHCGDRELHGGGDARGRAISVTHGHNQQRSGEFSTAPACISLVPLSAGHCALPSACLTRTRTRNLTLCMPAPGIGVDSLRQVQHRHRTELPHPCQGVVG